MHLSAQMIESKLSQIKVAKLPEAASSHTRRSGSDKGLLPLIRMEVRVAVLHEECEGQQVTESNVHFC